MRPSISVAILLLLAILQIVSAFRVPKTYHQSKGPSIVVLDRSNNRRNAPCGYRRSAGCLTTTSKDDDFGGEKKKFEARRIGGRRGSRLRNNDPPFNKFVNPPLLVVLLLVGLITKSLLGGNGDNDSYYYYSYQTTVYESRSYDADGKVQTSRRSSGNVQSNIPGLKDAKPEDARRIFQERNDYFLDSKSMFDTFIEEQMGTFE